MKSLKTGLIVVGSAALILLTASGNTVQATNANKPDDFLPQIGAKKSSTAPTQIADNHGTSKSSKGGQVVESGPYHLELVVEKEAAQTHLDFYLQRGDNHQTIPNAKVTSQIQMPDPTQKTVTFTYDQKEQHYTALLPGKVVGQYQMKITADISGQKVDGRFTFNR